MDEYQKRKLSTKPYPVFIPMTSAQYKPLAPIQEDQLTITQIMLTPYPHLGGALVVDSSHLLESSQRLMDVLSGKYVPFHGAAEYLQNIRKGRA